MIPLPYFTSLLDPTVYSLYSYSLTSIDICSSSYKNCIFSLSLDPQTWALKLAMPDGRAHPWRSQKIEQRHKCDGFWKTASGVSNCLLDARNSSDFITTSKKNRQKSGSDRMDVILLVCQRITPKCVVVANLDATSWNFWKTPQMIVWRKHAE